jgi:hypothetical protein
MRRLVLFENTRKLVCLLQTQRCFRWQNPQSFRVTNCVKKFRKTWLWQTFWLIDCVLNFCLPANRLSQQVKALFHIALLENSRLKHSTFTDINLHDRKTRCAWHLLHETASCVTKKNQFQLIARDLNRRGKSHNLILKQSSANYLLLFSSFTLLDAWSSLVNHSRRRETFCGFIIHSLSLCMQTLLFNYE